MNGGGHCRMRFQELADAVTIPPDAADHDLIVDLPRRSIADSGRLGADEGFAPWWPVLLDHDREAMAA
jgi:hypothetical protein